MTPPDYQQSVAVFTAEHNLDAPLAFRLLDLASEVGELAKEMLKSTQYGGEPFEPDAAWEEELADVFFALICLANSTDVDLNAALDSALAKYRARLASRGDAGSGQ